MHPSTIVICQTNDNDIFAFEGMVRHRYGHDASMKSLYFKKHSKPLFKVLFVTSRKHTICLINFIPSHLVLDDLFLREAKVHPVSGLGVFETEGALVQLGYRLFCVQ